ncbi:MAG: YcfL family protein [Victivallales bacterium]|nr:YcfL family protein [Victivallales bacterium]
MKGKMMKKLAPFTVLILVVMLGCASDSTSGLELTLKEGGSQPIIRIVDSSFKRHIDVEEAIMRRGKTGFLEASVCVRNRKKKDYPIQYKFFWFDADGMEIQPGARPWEQTTLHGGEAVTLSATAPEKGGSKFIIRLRRIQ